MTRTPQERLALPGSAGYDRPPEPACFLSAYPGYRNPGASEAASQLIRQDWRKTARGRVQTMDQYLDLLGLPSAGALRASAGLASNVDDVERFLAFVEMTYRDRVVGTGGLAPRRGC